MEGESEEFRARGRGSSSTASSATTSSTAASWSSATPGCPRSTTAVRPAGSARTRCTATPPARPTSSACRCATRGPRTTGAGRPWSTATRPVPYAIVDQQHHLPGHRLPCSAASSPRCAGRSASWSTYRPSRSGTSRCKPLAAEAPGGQEGRPLDLADVHGRRIVETRAHGPGHGARGERRGGPGGHEPVRGGPAAAAVPAADDGALTATSQEEGYLEHPAEAFAAVPGGRRRAGRVRGEAHGLAGGGAGLPGRGGGRASASASRRADRAPLYTRTGRPFFDDAAGHRGGPRRGCGRRSPEAGLWDELDTDWLLLDAELLPWSLKASGLLRTQYAAVGAASGRGLPAARWPRWRAPRRAASTSAGCWRGSGNGPRTPAAFTDAYRRYCWTDGRAGRRAAGAVPDPGACQGRSLAAVPHDEQLACWTGWWQRTTAARRPARSTHPAARRRHRRPESSVAGRRRLVAGDDRPRAARAWSSSRCRRSCGARRAAGAARHQVPGPGVPADHLRSRVHPAREPGRGCASRFLGHKRSLALREYALGLEALDRLAEGEPLWRVHEAVFAVLALESEPVDPRL